VKIAGIILAGGASRRMGSPKALLQLDGEAFVGRLIRVLAEACDPVIVVLGHDANRIQAVLSAQAITTVNPAPERGQLSSLHCALRVVPFEAGAVMFTPVDYPAVRPETVLRLAGAMADKAPPVVVPRHDGRRGHPVCVRADVASELLALGPDERASDVIHRYRPQTLYVDVADPGILDDVDDPEAYRRLTGDWEPA
jgi:CTP:molybdopterin cytidylyltransferase MocA